MSMIINIKTKMIESQSHRIYPENWNGDGWVPVPPELENIVVNSAPYCELMWCLQSARLGAKSC